MEPAKLDFTTNPGAMNNFFQDQHINATKNVNGIIVLTCANEESFILQGKKEDL
jgi:hypothetical protein